MSVDPVGLVRFRVNPPLTEERPKRKRPKRYTETREYISMVKRILDALAPRVGGGDERDLTALIGLAQAVDDVTREAVRRLRFDGFTWQTIGEAAGVTRQAAQQRWGAP